MKSEKNQKSQGWFKFKLNRRDFIKIGSLAGGAVAGAMAYKKIGNAQFGGGDSASDNLETDSSVNIRYSVCLNCHNKCGIKARVRNGVLIKLDGSPYHPNNADDPTRYTGPGQPRLNFNTPLSTARTLSGSLCAKGQAGVQVLYNPYRIRTPLRRVGPRGSGQWESISWDEALTEIAAGSPVLGTPGLAQLQDFTNNISSDPIMGKKVNGVICSPGRIQDGQNWFWDLFWKNGYGTINFRHDHTSICETSRHVANNLLSGTNHFMPDILSSKCIIWFGANPLESNFAMIPMARKLVENKKKGGKIIVVDPRFSHTASKADLWLPIKPGTDIALAFAIARYIIENNLYQTAFLSAVNGPAAGESSWTEATFLIRTDTNRYLKASEVDSIIGGTGNVVLIGGTETDTAVVAPGTAADLDAEATLLLSGTPVLCKTAFRLYKERVMEKTIHEYAQICGVEADLIKQAAQMFIDAAPACSAYHYRGPAMHTNGTYQAMAIQILNLLAGNLDHIGGYQTGGGRPKPEGGAVAGQLNVKNVIGGLSPTGVRLTRAPEKYETTAEYATYGYNGANGHPRRPWFPLGQNGNYQEIFPSMQDEYPYPASAYIAYWNAIPYSTPGAKEVYREVLTATGMGGYKIPLVVVFDIEFSESAQFADFILPDTTYLERWGTPGADPIILAKGIPFRVPVVGKFLIGGTYKDASDPSLTIAELNQMADDVTNGVAGDPLSSTPYYKPAVPGPMILEDILIQLGKKIKAAGGVCPSVGTGVYNLAGTAPGFTANLNSAWDFYRNLLNNIAVETGASNQDIYDRGGIWEDVGNELGTDGLVKHKFAKVHRLFSDTLAGTKDSMTGLNFDGIPPLVVEVRDVLNQPVQDLGKFRLVTYKLPWHGQARTAILPWLMELRPNNFVELNKEDANQLGIKTGDLVRVTSRNNSLGREYLLEGIAYVTNRVRPGVVAISHHFGHWAMSSKPVIVDGLPTEYDPKRGNGITANPIMRIDPVLGNVTLQDKIGGSACFYDTLVNIKKI